jgi:hypothetical protein
MNGPFERADARLDLIHARAQSVKWMSIQLAWEANGDLNIEQAASLLLQAFHCLNRAVSPVESAKAS